jgi:multisubunit Na+/H+ antiporter MnhB subunit
METDAKVRLAAKAAEVSEIATRSLGPLGKAVAFISGFLGLPLVPVFIVWLCFEHRGEKQKGRDMWTFALFGFGTLIVVVIIVAFIASMSADRVGHRLR